MRIGGVYKARMETKDGSAGFDFEATYNDIHELESFSYEFGGRVATVEFYLWIQIIKIKVNTVDTWPKHLFL